MASHRRCGKGEKTLGSSGLEPILFFGGAGKASKSARMEAIPVSLPVPFDSESMDLFYSEQSKSIHGFPSY